MIDLLSSFEFGMVLFGFAIALWIVGFHLKVNKAIRQREEEWGKTNEHC